MLTDCKVLVRINAKRGDMSADSYITVLDESLGLLKDLDRRISDRQKGTLKWMISHLRDHGSAMVELEARRVRGETNYAPKVCETFSRGMTVLQTQGVTPQYFSTDNLVRVQKMVQSFVHDGIKGVEYSTPGQKPAGTINRKLAQTLDDLIGEHHKTLGAVEGTIEMISLRKGRRKFNIYHSLTGKAVKCNFTEAIEDDVFEAARGRRRIIVSGIVSYNVRGEPLSVVLDAPLRFLGERKNLPTVRDMLGLDNAFTGDLSTEDFVRSMRDG